MQLLLLNTVSKKLKHKVTGKVDSICVDESIILIFYILSSMVKTTNKARTAS